MGLITHELSITVLRIVAGCFILLGIFYPWIADRIGLEEGDGGQRVLSILLGAMLLVLLWIYQLAKASL